MSVRLSNGCLGQAADNLTTALDVEPPSGSRSFAHGIGLRPLWVQTAFIAWPHPFCVCRPDLAPEDFTVHSCASPNPQCPAVCHTLTLIPSSLALFQVEVLLIWSQITSCTILNLSLRGQTHTCIRKTYCS